MSEDQRFEGVKWDRAGELSYGGYLGLDAVLNAQAPLSGEHDELLFIIIHQTKELWLKQIIHELRLALALVRDDKLIEVHKNLSRVSRIQAVMRSTSAAGSSTSGAKEGVWNGAVMRSILWWWRIGRQADGLPCRIRSWEGIPGIRRPSGPYDPRGSARRST